MAYATALINAQLPHAAAVTANEVPRPQVPALPLHGRRGHAFPSDGT